jgi:subtilisin family serine protease
MIWHEGRGRVALFLFALMLASWTRANGTDSAMQRDARMTPGASFAEGEVLVRFRPEVTMAAAAMQAADVKAGAVQEFRVLSELRRRPFLLLRSSSLTTAELLSALGANPDVEAVSPNYCRRAQRLPNDPKYASQWGLARIKAPEAWERTVGTSGAVLALIDTGVDYGHADLKANMWRNPGETAGNGIDDDGNGYVDDVYGYDFASDPSGGNDSDPMDIDDHGTHVAGIMAAVGNNGTGVCGVNWIARVMALKAFRPNMFIYDSDCIEAIEYAVMMKRDYGINVVAINASFGGGGENPLQKDAIEEAGNQGIAFVCAAGNDGENIDHAPFYPASYDLTNLVAVAATDEEDRLASFSNFGTGSVDIAAPGVDIFSTTPPGKGQEAWLQSGGDVLNALPMEYCGQTPTAGLPRPIYHCGLGRSPTDFPAGISGNIALIERGEITFEQKTANAQSAGAAGVVIYNNEAGGFSGTLGHAGSWVPAVSISREDGLAVKARGIHEVKLACFPSSYGLNSGTSMASPHVCGALGLLAAQFPGDELPKRLGRLFSGADRIASLENRIRTGARLNLVRALAQSLVVTMTVSRCRASAWVIARDYARVFFSVEKDADSSISGESYTVYRKSAGGSYQAVREIAASQLQNGACTYHDKYLEHDAEYTYVIQASGAQGEVLALSNEQSI